MTSPRAIKAGEAFVEMSLRRAGMERDLQSLERRLNRFADSVARIGGAAAALGGALAAPLAVSTKIFADVGDRLDKMSIRTRVNAQALSELEFAANRSGSSLQSLATVLQRMNRRLGRVFVGEGAASEIASIEKLGLNVEDLRTKSTEEQFLALADALANAEDKAVAAGLAQRLFDTQVDDLLPLLLLGSDGIAKLREEARRLGITIGDQAASEAAMLTDELGDTTAQMRALAFAVGRALGPVLIGAMNGVQAVTGVLIVLAQTCPGLIQAVAVTAGVLLTLGGIMLSVAAVSLLTSVSIKVLSGSLFALNIVFNLMTTTVGFIVTIVLAAVFALLKLFGVLDDFVSWIGRVLGLEELGEARARLRAQSAEVERLRGQIGSSAGGIAAAAESSFGSFNARELDSRVFPGTGSKQDEMAKNIADIREFLFGRMRDLLGWA